MKLSVIIPVYNVAEYLESCLDSLTGQSYQDMEIIMINDGSTDESSKICHKYAAMDNRFRVYDQINKGAAAARNVGLNYATGEWITFVDGDDIIEKGFLKRINLESYRQADIVFYGYSRLGKDGQLLRIPLPKYEGRLEPDSAKMFSKFILNPDILDNNENFPKAHVISGPCVKLYRKSFLDRYKLRFRTDIKIGEDNYFNFMVYSHNPCCYACNIYMYIYRDNPMSLTKKYNEHIDDFVMENYKALRNYIQDMGEMNEYQQYLPARIVRNFLYCCALDYCHKDNPKPFLQRRKDFLKQRHSPVYEYAFQRIILSTLRPTVRIGAFLSKYKLFGMYCLSWRLIELLHVRHA